MDETKRSDEPSDKPSAEPELKHSEEGVKDLEPDEKEGEGVEGGATDLFMKI